MPAQPPRLTSRLINSISTAVDRGFEARVVPLQIAESKTAARFAESDARIAVVTPFGVIGFRTHKRIFIRKDDARSARTHLVLRKFRTRDPAHQRSAEERCQT